MDLLSVMAIQSTEQKVQVLVEAVQALERDLGAARIVADAVGATATGDAATTLVQGGFVERVLGEVRADASAVPAEPAGVLPDHSPETANLQAFARPHAPLTEPLPRADTVLPAADHAASDFALPSSLLVPATLIGLQVQHAAAWPLPGHGVARDPVPPPVSRDDERRPPPQPEPEDGAADHESTAAMPAREDADAAHPDNIVLDARDDGRWCEALTRALRSALAARVPPRSLLAAAEQWQRGRCVVLACPQGDDPAGPAWAFVLWPRAVPAGSDDDNDRGRAPLMLHGLRVEASLQWHTLPPPFAWCHVRVIKEHHPRRGRQLVPTDSAAGVRMPCDVQLGPPLGASSRGCEVRVHVRAAQRFWAALGAQWSAHLVVSARPLLPISPPPPQDAARC
jgi:hypothetical protein